ncbi:MAG: hypothetical protein PHV17_09330 [Candidatus Omnitrophica bacterium]|nr:hypothetical protein [Candidatus Omnitrophota bacterium]
MKLRVFRVVSLGENQLSADEILNILSKYSASLNDRSNFFSVMDCTDEIIRVKSPDKGALVSS